MIVGPVYLRFAEPRLVEALADTPVVLIHGPRQCGKTTLAQVVGRKRDAYFSFDDGVTLAAATADPVGFVVRGVPRMRAASTLSVSIPQF